MKGRKTGGRSKGTPNASSLDVRAIAERIGVDPFEIMCMVAKGDYSGLGYETDIISLDQRIGCAIQASKYLYQQRKAVELSTDEKGFNVIIKDYSSK